MEALAEIEEFVVRFEGRGPGTDAERRAARFLEGRLARLGREAETEPAWVRPNWPLAHVLHAVLAILASLVGVANGRLGLALALVAAVSALGDVSGRFHLLRRLTGRRATQSVVSREQSPKPGTLVLVAHYDAARSGAIYGLPSRLWAALSRRIRVPLGPFDPYVAALLVVCATLALRASGVTGAAVALPQFAATIVLILSIPLLVDVALSAIVPGANDNASGVATVLRLAERYGGALDHFDVWVLFPGASEAMQLGMRAWLRRHRRELERSRTVFLNVDQVGDGSVIYATREGFLAASRYHPMLLELCDQITREDAGENLYGARRRAARSGSDAHTARAFRYPAISISCLGPAAAAPENHRTTDLPERLDAGALERAYGFSSELVELIDERIGPTLAAAVRDTRSPVRALGE